MHIMIDIETLSNKPNAAVLAYSALPFSFTENPEESRGMLQNRITYAIQLSEQADRHIDAKTLQWWIDQPDTFMEVCHDSVHPQDALRGLREFIQQQCKKHVIHTSEVKIWAKSPSFDLVILKSLAEEHHIKMPWHYRNERDVRTLFAMANYTPEINEASHYPWQDCVQQIQQCQEAHKRITPNIS